MKDYMDDASYRKRQRCELWIQWLFCVAGVGLLLIIEIVDPPFLDGLIGGTMGIVVIGISMMYGLSRNHRRDHKQLHDLLIELREQRTKDVEPNAPGTTR